MSGAYKGPHRNGIERTLAATALFTVPFFFHTVYEESLFEHHFGEAYFQYQRRVPRLVPFVRMR